MEISSACHLINDLIYKPGWKINAEDHSHRFEGTVRIDCEYPAQATEREEAPEYARSFTARASFALIVGDCDNDVALYYRLLTEMVFHVDMHEAREFLRIRGTNWAPFHPHRIEGMKRWASLHNCQIHSDLQFGLA